MELDERKGLGKANLALHSFVASQHPAESCGHNGLPLTPNSIAILGQAEVLRSLDHPRLCTYLDFRRGKHERIVSVSEFYEENFQDNFEAKPLELTQVAIQVLQALDFLQSKNINVMNLSSKNILWAEENEIKLYNYGLAHMTDYGRLVGFPIFAAKTVAPEVLRQGPLKTQSHLDETADADGNLDSISHILPARDPPYSVKCAVWTLGMIALAKCLGYNSEEDLWPSLQPSQVLRKVLSFSLSSQEMLTRLAREFNGEETIKCLPDEILLLLRSCLVSNPDDRFQPAQVLKVLNAHRSLNPSVNHIFPTTALRCLHLELNNIDDTDKLDHDHEETLLHSLSLREIYYLWLLAGGDIMSELRKHGLMVSMPPVLNLPKLLLVEGHQQGKVMEKCALYDPMDILLPMHQLTNCLSDLSMTIEDAYPLLLMNSNNHEKNMDEDDMASLPLIIKERDVKYQYKRVAMFRRLLQGYPYTRKLIWKEARIDTLPLYRAWIWASLLGIDHDVQAAYAAIDKESWTSTDRQIEVDIPRCHQYNNLLASPEGHRKFKRVLKAWVATNPQYVYWQGLDSLCAPFLYLNFNDEALAFACLSAFIPKYLHGMFRKDNAAVIQEYLAKFSHLIAFHDPLLFNHLDGIGFIPDLYAIPWILTMFAHVFPLQSIFHLWDKLLLGNESFPLCVALAILLQLKNRLLESEFNDCILLFSDLPSIDLEQCVNASIRIFCATPKSLTFRRFGLPTNPVDNDLSLSSITLSMQKEDRVPRISGEELLSLLGLKNEMKNHENESHFINPSKPKAFVIDVRSKAEFKLGSLPDSFNIPFQVETFDADTIELKLKNEEALDLARHKKSKVVCVVGSASNHADTKTFAEKLLQLNYYRVCYLHNGIEIFRTLNGILCVPDT